MNLDNIVKFTTLGIGTLGLYKALIEYARAQKWKKAEFLAKEVKEFFADENVKRALIMLDWNIIDINLFNGEIEGKSKFPFVDDMLESALKHHNEALFSEEETVIRKTFDDFLFKLGMFQNYIDSKLISKKDIEPYLIYWIDLICNLTLERKEGKCLKQLWKFINYYDYKPVIKLFKGFNYDIVTETLK